MNPKQRNRLELSLSALCGLVAREGEWVGAVELGEALALPWRPLAFTLRRLAGKGLVQERIFIVRGTARTKEEQRRYRLGGEAAHPLLPQVHPVPRAAVRRVAGRAGVMGA